MTWLEVSLAVNGELAEAVVEVLARFAPNSVATEQGVRYATSEDEGSPDGPVTVRAYISVDERTAAIRLQIEESLHYLGLIQPLPAPAFSLVADQNWMEAWKQHYRPIAVGQHLMVVPAWLDVKQVGRIPIRINPGMAFGTGTHPSTQLCLELIEGALGAAAPRDGGSVSRRPATFIDVGCGSGILSIAALKLGATSALAVDIDPDAIANARENAALNGIGSELVLGVGSLKDILGGRFPGTSAWVVAANILAPVIVRLFAEGLGQLIQEGGSIVLGGILHDQAEGVLKAAQEAGVTPTERRQAGDWVALRMQR
jgi:ribosomal protein L11 methyltransferase